MNWKKHHGFHIIPLILGGFALAVAMAFIFGAVVMLLWNWLMPAIFGLGTITYWQGWGLVLLSHILFKPGHSKSYRPSRREWSHDDYWRAKMRERFHREAADSAEEEEARGEKDP